MEYIMNDVLSGAIVPVLLGVTSEASETAHRMYRQHGVISHVFCDHIPLSMRLSLCMKFHRVPKTLGEQLLLQALADFADQLGNADLILYLIPCNEHYSNWVWDHTEELERRFVLADRAEMERVWFGATSARPTEVTP